ncbi:MAG: DNA repair protein RecN [Clostridia bacterium]|nr:DNA repair protein RecN [Clostridia bacterium]
MLAELQIENFALIENLQLELGPGLTVFTGETGAGKSIIVDAVSLVVGARASAEYIRAGAERAVISGLFITDKLLELEETLHELGLPVEADGSLLLTREISRNGRHTCRINGRSTILSVYQKIGQMLVDIHGQHSYQSILRPVYQMDMLDSYAGLGELRSRVKEHFQSWQSLQKELASLTRGGSDWEQQQDLLNFQFKEITEANLNPDEETRLLQERDILNNAERLANGAAAIYTCLFEADNKSAYDLISQAAAELQTMAAIDPELQSWQEMLETAVAQVEEVARGIRRYSDKLDYDPQSLAMIEERLELINNLKRKYGGSIEAILQRREEIKAILGKIEHSAELAATLQEKIAAAEDRYRKEAERLHSLRAQAASKLAEEINAILKTLAMPEARVEIACTKTSQPGPNGLDNIIFLFQPNPGEGNMPLAQIASGGEMARVMLALKSVLASNDPVPSLIFDEIDAGVSGVAARTMAQTLANISHQHQVLCITHSAHLAGYADRHYLVSKFTDRGRTYTRVEELQGEARVEELARLLSGEASQVAKKHAETLLEQQ